MSLTYTVPSRRTLRSSARVGSAVAQRIAQADELGLVAIVSLQHAQVLADQLGDVVAR